MKNKFKELKTKVTFIVAKAKMKVGAIVAMTGVFLLSGGHVFAAGGTPAMPAFPSFDFSTVGKWFMDGALGILTSNMMWFILPGLAIAGVFGAISLIKRTGKKVTKG